MTLEEERRKLIDAIESCNDRETRACLYRKFDEMELKEVFKC
jgi:DNA-directed RNA polymerase specialized sigma subunit